MMDVIWSVVGFIIMMSLIVTIHEYGHFQVARWFNIKVTTFSIGFGKAIYRRQMGETEFKISSIPLGGFVKFVDEREGPVDEADLPRAFNRQNVYKRFAVVAAGPMINFILAWLAFVAMFMIGTNTVKPMISTATLASMNEAPPFAQAGAATEASWEVTAVNQLPVASWQNVHQQVLQALVADKKDLDVVVRSVQNPNSESLHFTLPMNGLSLNDADANWLKQLGFRPVALEVPAVIGQVLADSAGAKAGLKTDDQILSFNGQAIASWQALVEKVQQHPNETVALGLNRDGQNSVKMVTLDAIADPQDVNKLVGRLGVGVQVDENTMQPYMNHVQYGFVEASVQAYQRTLELLQMSWQMLKKMVMGEVSLEHLSGPLSIAQFSGQAVQSGLISFISLLGLLSLSIGFLNLLPIPVLDGGHLLYYVVEMIKGSPVSENVMLIGQNIGLFIIISLTFIALFNDVLRITNG